MTQQLFWDAGLATRLDEVTIRIDPDNPQATLKPIHRCLQTYGFAILSGLGADEAREIVAHRLISLSRHLGELLPQSPRAEAIEDVKDYSDIDERDDRGYRSRGELSPHSDPPTLILLHCLVAARDGGESHLVNVGAILQKMNAINETLTQRLFDEFPYWEVTGTHGLDHGGPAKTGRPVMTRYNGRISCVIYRPYIEKAAEAIGRPLSADQQAALDLFEQCASDAELSLRFTLQPGQSLLLHNRAVLHARTDYEDWPELHRRRHLLRAWIDAPALLPAAPQHELGDIFGGHIELRDLA